MVDVCCGPQGSGDRLSFRQKVDLLSQNATPIDQLFEVSTTIYAMPLAVSTLPPTPMLSNITFRSHSKSFHEKPKTVSRNSPAHLKQVVSDSGISLIFGWIENRK